MEKERSRNTHILVVPIPLQGHVNPMLQFANRVGSKGVAVTFVVADPQPGQPQPGPITFEPLSDAPRGDEKLESMLAWFQARAAARVPELMAAQEAEGRPFACVVYDSGLPWVLDLAKGRGVPGASFFTHSCAVACVYYSLNRGLLRIPLDQPRVSLPGLPALEADEMPSFVSDPESYPSMLKLVISRFSNVADWIFFIGFESLESEAVSWMRTLLPIKPIGPTIPPMYLDKRLEHDRDYGLGTHKPDPYACAKWLDSREEQSVAYVSFGSIANLKSEQVVELAEGLRRSACNVLWTLRDSELGKLPVEWVKDSAEKWLVVNWCNQLEVLAHKAVGCFVTHCGWNSVLEAVSLGVPMVAVPQWTDQRTNAKFVSDVWNVGLRARVGESGVAMREEIERCVGEVMGGERGRGMRESANGWKELAVEALSEGGTSDRNIHDFVADLVGKCK